MAPSNTSALIIVVWQRRKADALPADKRKRCSEIGCLKRTWHGSDYCLWHPKLQLARPTVTA